jgi:hypothetical protein
LLPPDRLACVGRRALRRADVRADLSLAAGPASPGLAAAEFRPASYETSTIPTERLTHCRLTFADGQRARIFVKEIRDVIHWPQLHMVPQHLRAQFIADFPWRLEIEAFTNGFGCDLPDGMRLPNVYLIDEVAAGRAALWMEDVAQLAGAVWTLPRYAHAAHLLGQLAARRRPSLVEPLSGGGTSLVGPNDSIRMMFGGRIEHIFRPAIESDALWDHPTVAAALDRTGDRALINDLRTLVASARRLIDLTDGVPMTYAHGDASPQNLLVPSDCPHTFVVIDPGFHSLLPVGHDLGQLLVGLCHAGEMDPDELAAVHDRILPAYAAGLAAAGMHVDPDDVRHGYQTGLLLRSGFTAIPLERLHVPTSEQSIALWTTRLRMTRNILTITKAA